MYSSLITLMSAIQGWKVQALLLFSMKERKTTVTKLFQKSIMCFLLEYQNNAMKQVCKCFVILVSTNDMYHHKLQHCCKQWQAAQEHLFYFTVSARAVHQQQRAIHKSALPVRDKQYGDFIFFEYTTFLLCYKPLNQLMHDSTCSRKKQE